MLYTVIHSGMSCCVVAIGDSLATPFPHPDNEIWCTLFYYLNYWHFVSGEAGENGRATNAVYGNGIIMGKDERR